MECPYHITTSIILTVSPLSPQSSCTSIRRQKELELEVVTGRVHGWEGGESLGTLGDVVRMGSVALLPDHRDRYLVLFPATLVTLAVSPRMTAFIFQVNELQHRA